MPRMPIVLFVGRLVENKGCEHLIQAMARVEAQCSDTELVVIGDGPRRKVLEDLAKTFVKRYRFLGLQAPAVVRQWMNRARVLCVPSVQAPSGASEGFGIVFVEAQAMGLPVVSFETGGIPEAVAEGETGFLFPSQDVCGLAASIVRLVQNDYLWTKMSEAARRRVVENFDLKRQTKKLEDIYWQVLRSERAAPLAPVTGNDEA